MVLAMTAAAYLLNSTWDGLLHPLHAQSRAQLISGFDYASLRRGSDLVSGKYSINKFDRVHCRCGGLQGYESYIGELEDVASEKENAVDKQAVDGLITAIIRQAEVEGGLTQAIKRITIEDWSKVLSNVGKRHWELALGVFAIFKETSTLFLKSKGTEAPLQNSNVLKVYTTMINVLGRHGRLDEAESILTEVQQMGYCLDLYLFNALLSAYAKKGMADRVIECMLQMQRACIEPDGHSYEQLVSAYLNMENPQLEVALQVLDHMCTANLKPSFKTYNALISACWYRFAVEDAEKCFSAMLTAGYSADAKIFYKMMQLYAEKGDYNRTEELFQMLKQAGLQPNSTCYQHVLTAYCKAGHTKQALSLFREAKLVSKPSILVYNMLLDACSKDGLHLQAMQLYNEVCNSGMRANAVTYTSTITALVSSGRYTKAEELYRKMLKHNLTPTAHTYTSMMNSYTSRGWTRLGHEICLAMRNTNCVITAEAYNAMLNLYLRGGWYTEGANLLAEMDGKGMEPNVSGYCVVITACGESSPDIYPVVKALQSSPWETFHIVHLLLFQPLYESLLEGNGAELPSEIFNFLKTMAETKDEQANLAFYNSIMDSMWRKGLKMRAKSMMLTARGLLPWYKRPKLTKSKLVLDLRGLSLGGAQVAVLDFLAGVAQAGLEEQELKVVLITGTGKRLSDEDRMSKGSTQKGVKKAVCSTLVELGSPFVEVPHGSGRLVAPVQEVVNWRSMYSIATALMLLDSNQPYITQ